MTNRVEDLGAQWCPGVRLAKLPLGRAHQTVESLCTDLRLQKSAGLVDLRVHQDHVQGISVQALDQNAADVLVPQGTPDNDAHLCAAHALLEQTQQRLERFVG